MDADEEPPSAELSVEVKAQSVAFSGAPTFGASTDVKSSLAPNEEVSAPSVDKVREEVVAWLSNKLSPVDSNKLQVLLKDYDSLKEKISKLKSLLGRSAKAQREAKVDLEATQKRLDHALREIDRLNKKIDKLANRPTHMELLADFETNFDRALLSVGQQTGGQDTAPPSSGPSLLHERDESAVVDSLLMQELHDSKLRIEKLESLNSALLHRSSQLEAEEKEKKREREELASKLSHLELEKRMAVMEAEHASKMMHEKAASLAEMQMEIDLVTKASVSANRRAAQGEEMIKTVKTDKQYVQQLEAKIQALQEWALASSEAKTLAQERVRQLEAQTKGLQEFSKSPRDSAERVLFTKSASLVVGAGDEGLRVIKLPEEVARSVKLSERVILRWKFDLLHEDATIEFNIIKAAYEKRAQRINADYLVKGRLVTGGAAGETENAFAIENACTLLWSNAKAWVRPKTVRYSIEAMALPY